MWEMDLEMLMREMRLFDYEFFMSGQVDEEDKEEKEYLQELIVRCRSIAAAAEAKLTNTPLPAWANLDAIAGAGE